MKADLTKLTFAVTVGQYEQLEQKGDRPAIAQFVRDRFDERYFCPIEAIPLGAKHGFTTMAVSCLVIETLESFYQGKGSTHGCSGPMFSAFFAHVTRLRAFGEGGDWFYKDIRCGILHQSETCGGWRICRSGPLIDQSGKRINATKFIRVLRKAVGDYSVQLQSDDVLWVLFKKKMKTICSNCRERPGDVRVQAPPPTSISLKL